MHNLHKIAIFSLIFGSFYASEGQAFFPIPVPIIGTDVANNSADMVENVNAAGEQAEQVEATIQKTIEELKSGNFGFDAVKSYADTITKINLPRLVPSTQAVSGVAENINDGDKASKAVENVYMNTFSSQGQQMQQAKANQQKNTQLLQMNVAAMYAHALATRVNLAKERDLPDTTLDSKNTREIIQGNRAMADKIVRRWNDILFMESQIAEYRGTQIMTSITLDSEQTTERKAASTSQGGNK